MNCTKFHHDDTQPYAAPIRFCLTIKFCLSKIALCISQREKMSVCLFTSQQRQVCCVTSEKGMAARSIQRNEDVSSIPMFLHIHTLHELWGRVGYKQNQEHHRINSLHKHCIQQCLHVTGFTSDWCPEQSVGGWLVVRTLLAPLSTHTAMYLLIQVSYCINGIISKIPHVF